MCIYIYICICIHIYLYMNVETAQIGKLNALGPGPKLSI